MPAKPYEPNDQDRRIVETMAGHGIPVEDIARVIKMSQHTMRKYYLDELQTGQTKANSMVAQSLYQKALGSGNGAVAACIFWLKVRAHWVEPRPTWEDPVPGKKEQLQAAAVQAVAGNKTSDWADDLGVGPVN